MAITTILNEKFFTINKRIVVVRNISDCLHSTSYIYISVQKKSFRSFFFKINIRSFFSFFPVVFKSSGDNSILVLILIQAHSRSVYIYIHIYVYVYFIYSFVYTEQYLSFVGFFLLIIVVGFQFLSLWLSLFVQLFFFIGLFLFLNIAIHIHTYT